jgi:isopentenyl diphosphate isomerase/L-lactate dehydrogenase-like FMN-dependent dehydrogenase
VLKALAAGANAVGIGRAYLYGLAAGGDEGVRRALALLQRELLRCMALAGCRTVAEAQGQILRRRH